MNLSSRAQVYRTRKAARVQKRLQMTRPYVGEHGPEFVTFTESGFARLLFAPTEPAITPYPAPKEHP